MCFQQSLIYVIGHIPMMKETTHHVLIISQAMAFRSESIQALFF